jgi:hypothetical protein
MTMTALSDADGAEIGSTPASHRGAAGSGALLLFEGTIADIVPRFLGLCAVRSWNALELECLNRAPNDHRSGSSAHVAARLIAVQI